MRHLFVIQDIGTGYEITNTKVVDDSFEVDTNRFVEATSLDFFEFVKTLLDDSHRVMYHNSVGIPTSASELLIEDLDELTVAKAKARTRAKHILKERLDWTIMFEFYRFQMASNYLVNRGYYITEDNREEKYLEIVATNDENLILILDGYLDAVDKIQPYYNIYRTYYKLKEDVNGAADVATINQFLSDFANVWN